MKLICYATPYQQPFARKYLLRSVREFEVVYNTSTREPDIPVMQDKAQVTYRMACELAAKGEEFLVWADNDVILVKPMVERLMALWSVNKPDVMYQSTCSMLCAGFFLARLTPKFLEFQKAVAECDSAYGVGGTGDQCAARKLSKVPGMAKVELLPEDEFWSPCGTAPSPLPPDSWLPQFPSNMLMAHMACVQWPCKPRLLEYTLDKYGL